MIKTGAWLWGRSLTTTIQHIGDTLFVRRLRIAEQLDALEVVDFVDEMKADSLTWRHDLNGRSL